MDKRSLSFLILIVILGAALRFAFLSKMPPSLNWDEVSQGYNAYSVLKTGMDQWGQKFPIFNFRAYGDYPTTLNLYLTIPFIVIFGLTDFAIRFPHALLGTLTLISIFFLTWGVTKNKNISLLTSLLAAIGPWYVFTSRFVLQSNLSVFLLITSLAFFVNRDRFKNFSLISYFLLLLTLFSYHTTRIFSPIFLLGGLFIYKPVSKRIWLSVLLFFALAGAILFNSGSRARGQVLFLVDQGAVNRIIELRKASKLPGVITRLVYNRPVYFVENFAKNYVTYFSPKFLFINGGTQYQFSIPGTGLIYLVNLPLFYIGLYLLIKKSLNSKPYSLFLLWLMIAPIPASLTNESYAVVRATTMLPIPEIVISLAAIEIVSKFKKDYWKILIPIYFIALFIGLTDIVIKYSTVYKTGYSSSWQYGYKEAVSIAKDNYSKYDKIIVTKKYGEPHEYFLFFMGYSPEKYLNDPGKITFYQSNWWWVDHFDKFWFVNDWQIKDLITESKIKIDCSKVKCLLITSPDNYPTGWHKLEKIDFLNGDPAFEIYENF